LSFRLTTNKSFDISAILLTNASNPTDVTGLLLIPEGDLAFRRGTELDAPDLKNRTRFRIVGLEIERDRPTG